MQDVCRGQMTSLLLGTLPVAWGVAGTRGWSTLKCRETCLPGRVRRIEDAPVGQV